jgi:PleD family two-component response regulator
MTNRPMPVASDQNRSAVQLRAGQPLPRLLLAEDPPMEREMLQQFLQQGGYAVDCASGGHEAPRSTRAWGS